jgi:hypothetical protein
MEMCAIPEPEVIERKCGGFLAISPRFAQIKIGVTAPYREAAKDLFTIRYAAWLETLNN